MTERELAADKRLCERAKATGTRPSRAYAALALRYIVEVKRLRKELKEAAMRTYRAALP